MTDNKRQRDAAGNVIPTIKERLELVRGGIVTAMGLTHAANDIGDLDLPGSSVQADDLTRQAYAALVEASEQLYWVISLPDHGGDRAVLATLAPGIDQEVTR